MTTIDELRVPIVNQSDVDAFSAAVLRAGAFPITRDLWDHAQPESGLSLQIDVVQVRSRWGVGYVGKIGADGRPYREFRSIADEQFRRRLVYGLSEAGQVEYAGIMHSHAWWAEEDRRARRSEGSYRHDGLYRHSARRRYGGAE